MLAGPENLRVAEVGVICGLEEESKVGLAMLRTLRAEVAFGAVQVDILGDKLVVNQKANLERKFHETVENTGKGGELLGFLSLQRSCWSNKRCHIQSVWLEAIAGSSGAHTSQCQVCHTGRRQTR